MKSNQHTTFYLSGETRVHLRQRAQIEVATSVCTGGSNMPPAYCDLIFRVSHSKEKCRDGIKPFLHFWSEWRDSNSRHPGPKPMSEPSDRPLAPSLALSSTPAVPLWNSFALFVSSATFVFWDLCGMEFCILKVLPTGIASGGGRFCHRE